MSIEKQVRRELRRAAFWRIVVAILVLPEALLKGVAQLVIRFAELFDSMSDAAFYFELEAARRYRALTGIDLGLATEGSYSRYAGTDPKALETAARDEFGEDDDEA